MPSESFCKQFRKRGWATLPSSPRSPQRGTLSPKGSGSSPDPAAVQYQRNHWPDETLPPQAHPIHFTQETTEKPWSRLECEQTHKAKTNFHKIWAYQRSKGFSGFLNVTKKKIFFFFFCHFSGTYCFCFYCFFFFLVWSHKPTEKGLEKLIFQGGNRRCTFVFKEVQFRSILHRETNHREQLIWKIKTQNSWTGFPKWWTCRFCPPF